MALQTLKFTFQAETPQKKLPAGISHTGVVGSGDLEILLTSLPLGGRVEVEITTPVSGFDGVWQKVLDKFIQDSGLADVKIEINDNNATPFMVAARLRQAVLEAEEVQP